MFGSKTKTQPSHYPLLPFHLIRIASLLSSLVVSAIMIYFCYHLKHDGFKIPWTFLVLMAVSFLTLAMLALTSILHCCHVLSPRLSLFLNVPLLVLWALSFSLLGWNMSGTLGHVCNTSNWGTDAGIMICRIYKALFSFTVTGFVSALAAVWLDVKVRRTQVRRGVYNQMGDPRLSSRGDIKMGGLGGLVNHAAPIDGQTVGIEPYRNEGHEAAQQERFYNPEARWKNQKTMRAEDFGYAAPAEQTTYDAGSYGDGDRH